MVSGAPERVPSFDDSARNSTKGFYKVVLCDMKEYVNLTTPQLLQRRAGMFSNSEAIEWLRRWAGHLFYLQLGARHLQNQPELDLAIARTSSSRPRFALHSPTPFSPGFNARGEADAKGA